MLPGWIRWHEHSCPRSRRRARRADALVCPAEQGSATSWLASSALHLVPRFAEQVSFRRSRRGRRPRLPGRAKLGCSARVAACMWGASANFRIPASVGSAVPFVFHHTLGGSDTIGNPSLSSYQDYRFRGPNLLLLRESFEPRTRVVWGGHSCPPLLTSRVARSLP